MTFDETNAKILALLQRDSSLTNEAIGSEVKSVLYMGRHQACEEVAGQRRH